MEKGVKAFFLSLLAGLSALAFWNYLCKKRKQSEIERAYGKTVRVDHYNMTVDIKGEGNKTTIILLPGWGSPSPVLEFLPLAEELANKFRVITIEPFGYGLSDQSCRERKVDVIVGELHECTQALGCNQYYLMAHSIAGIYSLYWANTYPEEVQGFIGIDCSVPKQMDEEVFPIRMTTLNKIAAYIQHIKNITGITRLRTMRQPEKAVNADFSYSYPQKELEAFRILSIDYALNKTLINELDNAEANLELVRDMKFPCEIPVLQFLSEDNCKLLQTWEQLHRDIIAETDKSEVLRFGRQHYLHLEKRQDIAEKVTEWIGK